MNKQHYYFNRFLMCYIYLLAREKYQLVSLSIYPGIVLSAHYRENVQHSFIIYKNMSSVSPFLLPKYLLRVSASRWHLLDQPFER